MPSTTDQTPIASSHLDGDCLHAENSTERHRGHTVVQARQHSAAPRSFLLFTVAAALSLIITGCSSTTGSSTSTSPAAAGSASISASATSSSAGPSTTPSYPAGKEQVCQARDNLKTSLAALTNPNLLAGGTNAIKAAVDQVQTDLTAVATAGKQDYQPQVASMQSALTDLQSAVTNIGNGSGIDNLAAIGTAIAATGTASGALFTQLKTACSP